MTNLEKKLKSSLQRLEIETDVSVVIAVSGGPDSVAMLDALVRLREKSFRPKTINMAHLNHRLRGAESDQDERFVIDLAGRLGIDCFVERKDIADLACREKSNLEATARRIRYEFLRQVAEKSGSRIVFTGHTQDDQVETFLMRLLRGSSAEGLRGIHRIGPLGESVKLMRPLLTTTRQEVLEHCTYYRLIYRIDSSNLSTDFTRNRIRHELAPLLRSFNPRFDEAVVRIGEMIAENEDFIQTASLELFAKSEAGSELDIKPLQGSHPALRRRALRQWLRAICGGMQQIDFKHLIALERLIVQSQSGRTIELPGDWRATREFDRIILSRKGEPAIDSGNPGDPGSIGLTEESEQDFAGFKFVLRRHVPRESGWVTKTRDAGEYFALLGECKELDRLRIRTRKRGDAYIPEGRVHKIKLKTLMIRRKIPLSQRNNYPILVTADDRIVWSPGLPIAREFAVGENEKDAINCVLVIAQKKAER